RRRYDENNRAFAKQFYNWKAKGRQEHAALRETLYRMAGRRKAVWMPTFNEDLKLTADLGPSGTSLYIEKIGYKYIGSVQPIEGKRDVMLRDDSGAVHCVRVNSLGPDPAPNQERLILSGASGFTASAGRTGSFMSTVRLDQDVVEITHHTDSDGVCECSAAFAAFNNARSVTGPLILPTPSNEMSATGCGSPEADRPDGTCMPATFNGWLYQLKARHGPAGHTMVGPLGTWNVGITGFGGSSGGSPSGLAGNEIGWQWPSADPLALPSSGVAFEIMEQHGVDWDGVLGVEHEVTFYIRHWTDSAWRIVPLDPTYGSYSEFAGASAFGYPSLIIPPYVHVYASIFPCYWRVYS
ncbi:MAG TPA: hypothetical protein VK181_09380, partial [Rhizobium sp.]|nr:hypothetical protein [Rhizobium sp.]